jgi:hypothetical protein
MKSGPGEYPVGVSIALQDGRRFAYNVWTFRYHARVKAEGETSEPDLLVERLERRHLEDGRIGK